ncbi:MAG: SGNH/GDSL hydrolase family protein [Mucilaginibacter sp.]|uniref:SGNH/GDSL hydrolase family protein n=1 Tax=Mucilaginibacter sp. TaxID=1882438 RepID=UPI0031B27322
MIKILSDKFESSRRHFLKTASIGTLAAVGVPQIVSAALAAEKASKLKFNTGDVILFQGDSITDWGRDHKKNEYNTTAALGSGYALVTASKLLFDHADKGLKIYNKGVSGNKVYQLAERWDTDCLAIKPNILSIHIGVNDFWHTLNGSYSGTIDNYTADYKKLLTRTKEALPDVKLVICEPFASKGVKAVDDKWYPTFDLFRKAARDIATEYNAIFVPFQAAFDKAIETTPAAYWSLDGVHPSIAGEALMAQTWLKAVGA